jgi:hypothetical protein
VGGDGTVRSARATSESIQTLVPPRGVVVLVIDRQVVFPGAGNDGDDVVFSGTRNPLFVHVPVFAYHEPVPGIVVLVAVLAVVERHDFPSW